MGLKNKVLGLGLAAFLGMQALLPNNVKADLDRDIPKLENITKEDSKRKTNLLELGAYCLGSYGLTTFIHEGGHYLADSAFGAEGLKMDLVPRKDGDGIVFASVDYSGGMDKNEEIVSDLAGVGTTRINYEILNHYLKRNKVPDRFERFGSVLALFLRADLPRDLIFSSLRHYSNSESDYLDTYDIVNHNFDKKEGDYIYGGLLLLEGLDLYLDRKEIKNHIYRALGKPVSKEEEKKVDLNLDFIKDGFLVGLEYKF